MNTAFFQAIVNGSNTPPYGSCIFDSSDHIRFQNGIDVSGHNYNCYRRFVIEKNISGREGYSITMYNLDSSNPIWKENVQMGTKRMKIVNTTDDIIEFKGYGYDENAVAMGVPKQLASFDNYGIVLKINDSEIEMLQLLMYDRNVSIIYMK